MSQQAPFPAEPGKADRYAREMMRRETRIYQYPTHGVRVCERMLHNAEAHGEMLCSVEKDFILGCGVTFRMLFRKEQPPHRFRVQAIYGKLRNEDDPVFEGGKFHAVLSMKAFWITLGYYYFLEEGTAQQVPAGDRLKAPPEE